MGFWLRNDSQYAMLKLIFALGFQGSWSLYGWACADAAASEGKQSN